MIALDTHFHNHVCKVEVHYVNLDDIPWTLKDPLLSLISESDLLSKGIEQRYLGTFSEDVIEEIKNVQELIGKPILDQAFIGSASEKSSSSKMISTGFSNQSAQSSSEDDIHMQIIHFGRNDALDEFIQVLQLLLKESREPIRPHMNIL